MTGICSLLEILIKSVYFEFIAKVNHSSHVDDDGIFLINVPHDKYSYKMKQLWLILCLAVRLVSNQISLEDEVTNN